MLTQIGMWEVGLRQGVLSSVLEYKESVNAADKKTKLLESPETLQVTVFHSYFCFS